MNLAMNPFSVFVDSIGNGMNDIGTGVDAMGEGVCELGQGVARGVSFVGRKTWSGVCFLSGTAWSAAKTTGSFVREHSPFYSIPDKGFTYANPSNGFKGKIPNSAKGAVVPSNAIKEMKNLKAATQKVCVVALVGVAFTAFMIYLAVQQKSSIAITFAVLAGVATAGGTGYFLYQRHQHRKTLYGGNGIKGLLNCENTAKQLAAIYSSSEMNDLQQWEEIKTAFKKQYKKELKNEKDLPNAQKVFTQALNALNAKISTNQQGN